MTDITPIGGLLPGDDFQIRVYIEDTNGNAITGASASLTLTIEKPDGVNENNLTGGDLTEEGSGWYYYNYSIPRAGEFKAAWIYDGTNDRVMEMSFSVTRPEVSITLPA